jgi:hypothetical protein
VTGGGVSGNDMPSLPRPARQDVSDVDDAFLESLLAGNGLRAGAGAELRPVADALAALTAQPAGDELTGLAAARAEFRRRVSEPVRVRQSHRRRSVGLVSRLSVRVASAAAVVVMGFGGAAAVAYAGALPSSWQQFAHRTIGAPAHGAPHEARAATRAAGSAAHRPSSRHAAYQGPSGGSPASHGSSHHTRPPLHAAPPTARPFIHLVRPPIVIPVGRWPSPWRTTVHWPVRTEQIGPDASGSNAASGRGVS